MLSFASIASDDPVAQARLQRLHDTSGELPRRKVLGISLGQRGIGEAKAEVMVELNVDAVKRLLTHFDDEAGKEQLWSHLAEAYGKRHNLQEPPEWPVPSLMKDGAMAYVREKLFTFGDENASFLVARSAMQVLEAAHDESDPVTASKLLAKAFDVLRNDLHLAGALVNAARGDEDEGVEVELTFPEAKKLDAPEPAPAPADAAPESS